MDLEPKHYLLIYGLIVTPIALSFFFLRRKQPPVKLNLHNPSTEASARVHQQSVVAENVPNERDAKESVNVFASGERALNVFFQWNGHTWDAYEVLGLPAGSSPEAVEKAYRQIVAQSDPESLPFFEAAYEAILKNQR